MTTTEAEAVEAPDIGPGMVLGERYRLIRLLGEGGMGRVYLADDETTGDPVAVKVLVDDRFIPKATERFEREAQSIARIEHENVVKVSDVAQGPRGGLYYVMEYLDGEELATTLEREGPLPWWRVQHLGLQICSALQATHEAGVVHRDLKLENCFRVTRGDDRDFIKILDFGVAKLLGPAVDQGGRLTNTGATLGTPVYMAPELCRGKRVDHRVDIYALGVMLYELLAGIPPFEGEGFLDVALLHMNEPPPPLSGRLLPEELPPGLEAVVMRALAKDREDRFPTMAAMARALQQVGSDDPPAVTMSQPSEPVVAAGGTLPAVASADDWSAAAVGRTEVAPVEASGGFTPVPMHESVSEPIATGLGVGRAWPWLLGGLLLVGALVAWWMTAQSGEPEVPSEVVVPAVDEGPAEAASTGTVPVLEAVGSTSGRTSEGSSSGEIDSGSGASGDRRQPRGLSKAQVDAALRGIQPRVSTCAGKLTGAEPGDRARVTLKVDRASGKVLAATAAVTRGGTAVQGCVVRELRRAVFPRGGSGVQQIKRTITL
ncbi:serine/threonine-protein kinase [Paraliomyxa miuraensis]|uniref:serine/threonine-protein kinase n=1 Tax=Paraliomyxa miuraensis TaxID=376150 RepID=UPI0022568927|nr:serine/threonine-protein kinase [Paraliomyxa miuraensis]MCX4243056.1 protein kinase [Paraliomyxa miuraensis]